MNEETILGGILIVLGLLFCLAFLWKPFRYLWSQVKTGSGRKLIFGCGAIAFVLCGLFPPWLSVSYEGHAHAMGFSFILTPPSTWTRLDFSRLTVEWLCVVVATGTLLLLTTNSGKKVNESPVPQLPKTDKATEFPDPVSAALTTQSSAPDVSQSDKLGGRVK